MSGLVYNHYQILGVSEYASAEDIRSAYKTLAKKYHPDKHGGQVFYEEHFKKINEAYQTLSDPQKRARYDLQRQYRFTAPVSRPAAARHQSQQRRTQYRQATPPAPEGLTLSQLRLVFYVVCGMFVFAFLVIQFYGWMNRLASEDYTSKGITLEKERLYTAAYENFAKAIDFNPENSVALYHKGILAHTHLRNNTAAIIAFNAAIANSDSPDWKMYYYKGICHLEEREAQNAIFSFNKAIHLPKCPDSIYTALGDAYFLHNDLDKAIEAYTSYLSLYPNHIETLIKRGLSHHNLNHNALSLRDYEKAIELDPKNAAAYFYRAQVRFSTGDHEGAVNDLDTSASFEYRRAIRMKTEIENQEEMDSIINGMKDSVDVKQ